MSQKQNSELAIFGGSPVRDCPMPPRVALGHSEKQMIYKVLEYYDAKGVDPGYQGYFEELYCDAFISTMGGGFADAVATGTASIFIALAALDLPAGSEVLVSPITDPGTLNAIILNNLKPKLLDSAPGNYNVDSATVRQRISPNTAAIVIVHSAGTSVPELQSIIDCCQSQKIRIVEDCSQAHGATFNGEPVGSFGDVAAFSTMYRKAHISGGCGGIVYTKDNEIFKAATAHADRGKPRWKEGFDDRNPEEFLYPALNFHTDEISCGIGISSLNRLKSSVEKRLEFLKSVVDLIQKNSKVCFTPPHNPEASPFYFPIYVDAKKINCSVINFAKAVRAEGIPLNPSYRYLVYDWPWVKPYLADNFHTPNARDARDGSFCLYLNEKYGNVEAQQVLEAITKVERYYSV